MVKDVPCTLTVIKKTSKNGNPYKQLVLTIKEKEVPVGLCNVYVENALLRVGIDVNAD
jgi:hypothetical protein